MARDCEYFPPSHDDEVSRLKARIAELEALNHELEELRKHEVEWDMAKARIKELERQLKKEG